MAWSMEFGHLGSKINTNELAAGATPVNGLEKTNPKHQLMDLPIDLHVELFKHLSPTSSACLGLTCKTLYDIHWSRHGKVPLEGCDPKFSVLKVDTTLGYLIQDFMVPLALDWCGGTALFVPVEDLGVREKQAREAERLRQWPDYVQLMRRFDYFEQRLWEDLQEMEQGIEEAKKGVAEAKQGVEEVKQGIEEVNQGIEEVNQGIEEVKQGVEELNQDVEEVNQGLEVVARHVARYATLARELEERITASLSNN
ncbi:hypothetical protein N431DRAFT_469205 [Stipitochalara longipes BDJ]|nr:hypothetical protein N431DRAFT_469205 [Stipitochalara longipes BDJ]